MSSQIDSAIYQFSRRLREVAKERDALRAMLKRLEWTGVRENCYVCGYIKATGHAPDCELAALLKEDN